MMRVSVDSKYTPNKALHWMAIPLRSIATSELDRWLVAKIKVNGN